MNPYMNGLHQTIDGWRENRGDGGWKLRRFTRVEPEEAKGWKEEGTAAGP